MQQFLLLFRGGDPVAAGLSPQTAMQQWSAWIAELRRRDAFVHGEPLQDAAGLVLEAKGRRDGLLPGAPGDVVTGYLALRAADLEAAERLAAGCPVLAHGGRVELRPSWVFNGAPA